MNRHTSISVHLIATAAIACLLPLILQSPILAAEVLIFALAAIGCNLLLGYTGLLPFGQALFFGTGAYVASLAAIHWDSSMLPVLLFALLAGGALAVLVGFLSIRRQGIYFVMLTLAFGQLGYFIAYMAEGVTGGEDGMLDVPRAALDFWIIPSISLENDWTFYGWVALVFIASFVFLQRLVDSPLGSVLQAIKQNERRAIAVGYQVRLYKIAVFAFSGVVTALAGALYAMLLNFAPLSNIDLETSEVIIFMCVLGGLGSLYGSIVGAGVYLVATELLSDIWPRWMLLLGLLLIFVMLFARGGLWSGLTLLWEGFRNRNRNDELKKAEVSHD
ncbi:branched-chain amino acid ABC transporter permease [Neptuniibacter halophilus]|uniref:branched-chain amino acid ABC transporter permease n=1 Tax=Neptuniibacter halophilus TaxID=651666 RepID=UPI002572EADD|nr:branched-chain amino acid ABC transporter permease [Neptuniibacter halophilus]